MVEVTSSESHRHPLYKKNFTAYKNRIRPACEGACFNDKSMFSLTVCANTPFFINFPIGRGCCINKYDFQCYNTWVTVHLPLLKAKNILAYKKVSFIILGSYARNLTFIQKKWSLAALGRYWLERKKTPF